MLQFMTRSSLVASQLPLTREPRMWCGARDSADAKQAERSLKGKGDGVGRGMDVLLKWL